MPIDDSANMSECICRLFSSDKEYVRIRDNAEKSAKNYGFVNVKKELEKLYFSK